MTTAAKLPSNSSASFASATKLGMVAALASLLTGLTFAIGSPALRQPTPTAWQQDAETAGEPAHIPVENALLKTIETTHLAAEVSGRIESLSVVEGTKIKAGAAIGKISDPAIQLQLDRARIAMAIARKNQRSDIDYQLAVKRHEVAKDDLTRAVAANKRTPNTYTVKEIDRFQLLAESSKLEIDRAQHQRELAELEVLLAENDFRQSEELLARHQICSPVSGVVVSLNKRPGEWVEPGTELVQIVSTDRLRIEGFISANAAAEPLEGRPVQATVTIGQNQLVRRGRVVFVSPDANPLNNQVRVFLEIDNSDGMLRPGMRVQAAIEAEPTAATDSEAAPVSSEPNADAPAAAAADDADTPKPTVPTAKTR